MNNTQLNQVNIKSKRIYHVIDWRKYNEGLRNRYKLDTWITSKVISNWYHKPRARKPGAANKVINKIVDNFVENLG